MSSDPTTTAARPWAKRGRKGPTVIDDEGWERDGLPHDADDIGGGKYRDSEGGIWTVIPESEGRRAAALWNSYLGRKP